MGSEVTSRRMRRARVVKAGRWDSPLWTTAVCWTALWLTGGLGWQPLGAQQSEPGQITPEQAQPIGSDAKSAIQAAYERTQGAKSVADYTSVIELCGKAQVIGLSPPQEQYIKRLISWAHNRRGEAYADQAAKFLEQQETDKAAKLDAQALADFDIAVNNDPTRWKAIHNRGVNRALIGRYADAIKDFSRVIELEPTFENAWYNRAEIYYEIGQYAEAVEDYNQTLKLKPADFGAITSRGHAYFQLKKFREALLDYIDAVRAEPENALAYVNRADAYRSLSMWDQAANDYRRAIDLDKTMGRAYQSAAWLMATCPDERFRDKQRALLAAEQAIRLEGDGDFRYLDTLAAAYANNDQFQEAVETLSKAIEKAPPSEHASLQKRMELFRQQKPYRQTADTQTASAPPRQR